MFLLLYRYRVPDQGLMRPDEYKAVLLELRLSESWDKPIMVVGLLALLGAWSNWTIGLTRYTEKNGRMA